MYNIIIILCRTHFVTGLLLKLNQTIYCLHIKYKIITITYTRGHEVFWSITPALGRVMIINYRYYVCKI